MQSDVRETLRKHSVSLRNETELMPTRLEIPCFNVQRETIENAEKTCTRGHGDRRYNRRDRTISLVYFPADCVTLLHRSALN